MHFSPFRNSGHNEILFDIVAVGLTRPLVQFSSFNIHSNVTKILKNKFGQTALGGKFGRGKPCLVFESSSIWR